jgi:hypothetical protein
MKVKGTYKPYRNHRGSNYLKIPSFIEPADEYTIEILDDGTLINTPVRP